MSIKKVKVDSDSDLQSGVKLKAKLSLFSACSIITGVILGSGIFISPSVLVKHAGSAAISICILIVCGFYSTIGALCYAELGTTIPKSGGDYVYIYEAFGKFPAFLFLWIALMILNPSSNAAIAISFAKYILKPIFSDYMPDFSEQFVAITIIIFLTLANCYSVSFSTKIQNLAMIAKIVSVSIIIIAGMGFVLFNSKHHLNLNEFVENSNFKLTSLTYAFYSAVFSFAGWNYLNFVTEEIKEPERNLPRAIFISVPLVAFIYIFVALSYLAVIPASEAGLSDAIAVDFAKHLFGPIAGIVPFLISLSCAGSLNAIIFTCSRMFFVGARDGQLPELLAMINIKYLTPMPSLLFISILSIIFIFLGNIDSLISFTAFAETIVVTMAIAALVYLRFTRPDLPRPIKLNICIPILFILISCYILMSPFILFNNENESDETNNFMTLLLAVIITVSGIPLYILFVYCEQKPKIFYTPWVKLIHLIQKLLFCVTEDKCAIQ